MLTIESYIQKNKSDMIQSLLHASVTHEKVIYPVIGNKAYFEFVLENPFPEAKDVEISWKCSELRLFAYTIILEKGIFLIFHNFIVYFIILLLSDKYLHMMHIILLFSSS